MTAPIVNVNFFSLCLAASALFWTTSGIAATAENSARLNELVAGCIACHGVENTPAPTETAEIYKVPKIGQQQPRYIVNALKAYKSGDRKNAIMHEQASALSDEDMQLLGHYFAQEDAIEKLHQNVPDRHHTHPALVEQTCHACHGEIGLGVTPEVPVIANQYEDYLTHVLNDYRNGNRKNAAMTPVAKILTPQQIKEVTAYYSAQSILKAVNTPVTPVALAVRSIEMVDIPGGQFVMGAAPTDDLMLGQPQHHVTVPPFRLGKYSITFNQYDAFALDTGRPLPGDEGWGRGDRPVINVDWKDTQAFITWLNAQTDKHFRLPTEAEREYAAIAGTTTDYWWGDSGKSDSDYRNGRGVKGRDQWEFTAPVGQFPPNPYGIYDLVGNVFERTADCWHSDYKGAPMDGKAWISGPCYGHVIKGGYWKTPGNANYPRSRAAMADDMHSSGIGFRLAEDK